VLHPHCRLAAPVLAQMSKGVNCSRIVGIQRETLSKGFYGRGRVVTQERFPK
jgi:hypothetical protein